MFYFSQNQKMPSNYFENRPVAGNRIRPRRRPSTVSVKTATAGTGNILYKNQPEPEADRRAPAAAERRPIFHAPPPPRKIRRSSGAPRTDAADKIRRKSVRRDKFLMKFGGIPPKLIKFMSFLQKKYVFFSKNIVFSSFFCCKI
jgi:hypothetical protein